ncbi:MAG: hypothetical protein AABZ15_13380 [Nitrospirota bacterium]
MAMALIGNILADIACAQPSDRLVHAYYFKRMPSDYKKHELLIASLKDTGANTIILELPMSEQGFPDLRKIPNAVYLAHQAGLKLHIVLPTRQIPGILSQHSEWEDNQYALGSGTVQSTGKLDLFNKAAVDYLASLAKEIASYSVDALLLGSDFNYAPTEGIGPAAREQTMIDLKWAPDPRALFKKVSRGAEGPIIEEYGEHYGKWTAFKRDRLVYVFEQIRKAARSVNGGLKIGIPIHVVMPVTAEDKIFKQFAYDINSFRKLNSDYYWTAIEYRDIKTNQNLTYRQAIELLSRMAMSAITAVKIPDQVILALQATTETGSVIPMFEMEEITELVRRSDTTGIAYIIGPDATVNRTFMKKIFRKQAQP